MKHATRWVVLTCLLGLFAGCQDSESAANDASKRVDQQQQKIDRMDKSLDK